jgi:hypothetical protein
MLDALIGLHYGKKTTEYICAPTCRTGRLGTPRLLTGTDAVELYPCAIIIGWVTAFSDPLLAPLDPLGVNARHDIPMRRYWLPNAPLAPDRCETDPTLAYQTLEYPGECKSVVLLSNEPWRHEKPASTSLAYSIVHHLYDICTWACSASLNVRCTVHRRVDPGAEISGHERIRITHQWIQDANPLLKPGKSVGLLLLRRIFDKEPGVTAA